ncbi:MAG: HAD-IA family hydrolase [Hyphomicrobiaceae bacterium]
MTLILFDCDGTLVDSQNNIVAAMNQAFAAHGLKLAPRQSVMGVVGLSLANAIGRLLPDADRGQIERVAESYKLAFQDLRRQPEHHEPLFPLARETIESLAGRPGTRLGIATGKSRRGVDAILERQGWHGVFATIQTADDNPSKPHPGMLLRALLETGADATQAVMVGDTTFDIDMARAAGIHAIAVSWGYHDVASLERSGAHDLIDGFEQLTPAIDRFVASRKAVST